MNKYQYLLAPFIGWVVAQSIKFALFLRKDGVKVSDAFQSGGMPSSHSAFMAAITTVIGLQLGVSDPLFGFAIAVTAIFLYDAAGVRRATGQQTEALKIFARNTKQKLPEIVNAKGHTINEIIAGVLVGVVVGYIVHMLS
jgi:uncharacterized protein